MPIPLTSMLPTLCEASCPRAHPVNDGKQTPMRGHPVFIAQHATATCCRGCLAKWHNIPQGVQFAAQQQHYIVGVIHHWLVADERLMLIGADPVVIVL